MRASSLPDQIADLHRALMNARLAVERGAPISLMGLDDEVSALTTAAEAAPAASWDLLAAELEALEAEFDRLAEQMRRCRPAATPEGTAR